MMNKPPPAKTTSAATDGGPRDRDAATQLRRRAVRGSVMSLANQVVKLVTNLGTMLVLAVYLGPEEFGLFAVAFSVQALMMILREGGLANSLIQKKVISDVHLNSVLWVGVALSVVLVVGLAVLAQPLAAYYGRPQLTLILWLVAIPVVAQAFGAVQEAQLRKQVRFGRLLLADSGSAVLASLVAIVAVVLGAGVWALVLRMVVAPVLLAAFCWILSSWRPRWEFSLDALRSLWVFGGYLFLTVLMGYGMTRLDSLIIGKLIGVAAAGTFFLARNVALATLQELVGAVGRVMFPVFSAIQDDPAMLREGYLTGTRCLATLIFPIVAALVALSPEAVAVVLPEHWRATVPLIQIIALHGIFQCLNNPASQILYARGRSQIQFVYMAVIGLLVIASFVVGARWGVVGVAVSWTAVRFVSAPAVLWLAAREINMSIWRAIGNVVPAAVAAAVAAGAVRLTIWAWTTAGGQVGYALLVMATAVGGASYVAFCMLFLGDTLARLRRDLTDAKVMPHRRSRSIAVIGTVNWIDVTANLLRRAGLDARAIHVDRRWVPLRILFSPRFLSARVAHMVWGGDVPASLVAGCLLRKMLVWHWIGSDVPRYAAGRGLHQRLRQYLETHHVVAHLADSPELAVELKSLGIEASVCRLLPDSIEAEVLPLPEQFRVLSYWFDDRRVFYGGDLILALARQMPDVEFLIAGAYGKDAPVVPNVKYLGRLDSLDSVYRQTSVFLRFAQHDSLSAMVPEALVRGRYVICNRDYPGCHRADTLPEARRALDEIRTKIEPNMPGSRFVRENFSLQREADSLALVYASVIGERPEGSVAKSS